MEIVKKKPQRNQWTNCLRALKMEEEALVADKKYRNSIQTMATRLSKEEGMFFTFETDDATVSVWKIPVPARKYKKIC